MYLALNRSPFYTHRNDGVRYDFNHLIMECRPILVSSRRNLFSYLTANNLLIIYSIHILVI